MRLAVSSVRVPLPQPAQRPAPHRLASTAYRAVVCAADRWNSPASAPSRRALLTATTAAGGAALLRPAMAAAGSGEPVAMEVVAEGAAAAPAEGAAAAPPAEGAEGAAPAAPPKPSAIPRAELAPGLEISRIVKGCWQLSGGHAGDRATNRTSGQPAVDDFQEFVGTGITTFDTADIYGPSESLIGRYLSSHLDQKPNVQVLTKFCCFGDMLQEATDPRFVEQCVDTSRNRLGLESLDLVQFYWHDYRVKNYVQAAQNLALLQKKGKVKHVGATNFDVLRLQEFVDAGVTIANNQVQYSLLDRRPENGMSEFCAKHGVKLLPYGVLAGGLLTDKYLGAKPTSVKVDTYSKSKYLSVIRQAGGWEWFQSLLGALDEVAKKHSVTLADVSCRWVLDKPQVAGIIVGARNANHVTDLEKIFSFTLDDGDREKIAAVLAAGNQATSDCYTWERGGAW